MGGSLDTQPGYLGDDSCAGHAEQRVREYAAMVHFIGLVASGDEEALAALKTALADVIERKAKAAQGLGDAIGGYVTQPLYALYGTWAAQGAPGVPSAGTIDYSRQQVLERSNKYFSDLMSNIVNYFKSAYNKLIAAFEQGKVLEALCKATIDFGFFVTENLAIVAVGGMLGLGAGAGAAIAEIRILVTAVKEAAEIGITRVATRFVIALNRRDHPMNDVKFSRIIDTKTDLTAAERRALSETNQGTHSGPTADAAPVAAEAGPKWKKKAANGRTVYQRDDLIDPKRVDADGLTNKERMQRGQAPLGPDGEPINMHHMTQDEPGPMAEVTDTMHKHNFRELHMYTNQYDKKYKGPDGLWHDYSSAPDTMDRGSFNAWTSNYWKQRANDF